MFEVGIYYFFEVNVFVIGFFKCCLFVVVFLGLLQQMDDAVVEGVFVYEVVYIINGDMVMMMLLQGIVNMFVVFFFCIVVWIVSCFVKEDFVLVVYFIVMIVFQIIFFIFGSFVVFVYLCYREFYVDCGGVDFVGKDKMIYVLCMLKFYIGYVNEEDQMVVQMLKINGKKYLLLFFIYFDLDECICRFEVK